MNWHPFAEVFPLLDGDEWESFKAGIKATGGNKDQPIIIRTVNGKPEGIAGRNRWIACKELRIKPTTKTLKIKDEDVEAFIIRDNINRRHMTAEIRRELVAKFRANGHSVRQIAETIGASRGTVHRDIEEMGEESGVPFGTPEAQLSSENSQRPHGNVVGKDGKSYPATRPENIGDAHEGPIWCARCTRMKVQSTDCPQCKEAVEKAAKSANRKGTRKGPQKNGQQVYDWAPFRGPFGVLMRQIDVVAKLYGLANGSAEVEAIGEKLQAWKTAFESYVSAAAKRK